MRVMSRKLSFEPAHEIMVLVTQATREVLSEPSLFAHMKYGSRRRVRV